MEVINAAGKRVSLLNDEAPAAGAGRTAALPLHHRQPTPPKAAAGPTLPGRPSLPRPALASYSSSRSSSSTTSSSSSSSSYPPSSSSHTTHPPHSNISHPTPTSESTSYHSRDSRQSSSSINSPHYSPSARTVPQLLRHDSTASSQSLSTPSPMTPTAYYEPLDQGKGMLSADPVNYPFVSQSLSAQAVAAQHAAMTGSLSQQPLSLGNNAYYAQSAPAPMASTQGMYPSFPAMQAPMMNDPYVIGAPAVQYQFATDLIDTMAPAPGLAGASMASANGVANGQPDANAGGPNPSNPQQKAKKKYPCPHAARFGCTDTFTTSGHAARHGKKHTGEKNILCPTCHKAFTRKDNMKQHERTHKNRNNNHSVDETKPTGNSRRTQSVSSVAGSTLTHKSSGSTEMEMDSPITDAVDSKRNSLQRPGLSKSSPYMGALINGSDVKADHSLHRPELNRQFSGESQDGEGESPGLDALAMAASELR